MNEQYRKTTIEMESKGVATDYIIGWQVGYLGHPMREEQRVTPAYEAGYNDGRAKKVDGYGEWIGK